MKKTFILAFVGSMIVTAALAQTIKQPGEKKLDAASINKIVLKLCL